MSETNDMWTLYSKLNTEEDPIPFFEKMIQKGKDLTTMQSDMSQNTFLHNECYSCFSIKTIQYLIDKKADVNAQDIDGETPLHIAIENASPAIIQLLLDSKADPTLEAGGQNCIQLAQTRFEDMIDILRKGGPYQDLHRREVLRAEAIHNIIQKYETSS